MRSNKKVSIVATAALAFSCDENSSHAFSPLNSPQFPLSRNRHTSVAIAAGLNGNDGHYQQTTFPSYGNRALHIDISDPTHDDIYEMAMTKLSEPVPSYGMPWDFSISKNPEDPLVYMDFWKWQLQFMEENLTDLRPIRIPTEFSYQENNKKKARIINLGFRSKEYSKIRMTYYDAGAGCQVFNSLWYPDASYDLPVLGIDLLAFGRKRHLAIVDFQPLHDAPVDETNDGSWGHDVTFESLIEPIRKKHKDLQGKMSSKFYDETKFFSRQMLFSRFEKESLIQKSLFPAYQDYVRTHVDMMKSAVPNNSPSNKSRILERQSAYDTYSAERDPATGLFASMFGADWADKFVYDYLFSSSRPTPGVKAGSLAKHHGPPQPNASGASRQEVSGQENRVTSKL
mmetsp:Transcript_4983/g.10021  ORF Transcript_4983/g.10021 Transcript_4983/m.10021 type:complete len:399 (-) Transcript_4983:175-1371(-)